MEGRLMIFALGLSLALCSCTTPQTYAPEQAPEYVTIRNYTPFYRIGPMQSRPDASLPADTRFKLLRQEMGFSFVQLEDKRTGYVANENMAVAPPKPKPPEDEYASTGGGRKRGNTRAVYHGEQINDTPLPDNVPPPDLNIAPEVVPTGPAPTPTPPPEKPKFRF